MKLFPLLKVFNVRKKESELVAYLIAYTFFMGGAMAVFYTVVVSSFLTNFSSAEIPVSYVVGGLLVYALGIVIARMGKRGTFVKQSENLLLFLVISIAGMTVALQLTDHAWIVFVLFIWNRVFVLVHGVTFWAAVSRLFNLQQSKRLYGLINSGEVIASVLAYFSVPLLIRILPADDLLYGVVGMLAVCCVIQRRIHRQFMGAERKIEQSTGRGEEEMDDTQIRVSKEYYRNVFILAMLPVFGLLYIEYMFFVESRQSFPDRAVLAAFLGVFFGTCALMEFFIKTFLYDKLLFRYGLKAGILMLPVCLFFSFSLAAVYGLTNEKDTIVFFALIALARFFMSAVRKSVSEPSFQVLYKPIPSRVRLHMQRLIEGRAKAIGGLLAGAVLLLLQYIPGLGSIELALIYLPVTALWLFVSFNGQTLYRNLVRNQLDGFSTEQTALLKEQKAGITTSQGISFEKWQEKAGSPYPAERSAAAKGLGGSGRYAAYRYLIPLLQDPDPTVCGQAVEAAGNLALLRQEIWPNLIAQLHNERYAEQAENALAGIGPRFLPEVYRHLASGAEKPDFQRRMMNVALKIGGSEAIRLFRRELVNPDRQIREKAMESLVALGYRANASEANVLQTTCEEYLAFAAWLLAVWKDLVGSLGVTHPLMRALVADMARAVIRVFTILALIYNDKFSLIKKLLQDNREEDLRSFLIEICDIEVPGGLKRKVKPLLESDSPTEVLGHLDAYYPQVRLSVADRLFEIANKDLMRLSYWARAVALKELLKYPSEEVNDLYVANAVSPFPVLSQTALYCLKKINPGRFEVLIVDLSAEKDWFYPGIDSIFEGIETEEDLLVCRLGRLRLLQELKDVPDEPMVALMARSAYLKNGDRDEVRSGGDLVDSGGAFWVVVTYGSVVLRGTGRVFTPGVHHVSQMGGDALFRDLEVGGLAEVYVASAFVLPDKRIHRSEDATYVGSF